MNTPAGGSHLLVVGEALVDIVRTADAPADGSQDVEHVGGSPLNVAMGLSALDHDVELVTCVGDDARGERIRAHLAGRGVRVTSPDTTHPTSTALAELDAQGAAQYTFDLHWQISDEPLAPEVSHVHTGSIAAVIQPGGDQVLALVQDARAQATTSYDPNVRPSIMGDLGAVRERVERFVAASDVVKASEDDLELLYAGEPVDAVLSRWVELGALLTVVTRGADGVTYRVSSTTDTGAAPTRALTVVDTVGAGDSFMAGLLSGLADARLIDGRAGTAPGEVSEGVGARERLRAATLDDVRPAVERGLACAGLTVARAGAYAPTRSEVE